MSDDTQPNPNAAIVAQLAASAEKNARLTRWVFIGPRQGAGEEESAAVALCEAGGQRETARLGPFEPSAARAL